MPPQSAKGAMRRFLANGQSWLACEVRLNGRSSLLFFGPRVARRVCSYPTAWADLSDTELYELSWSR
jgi:hypothetical protein